VVKRSKRLESVVKIAESEEQAAARVLSESQQQLNAQQTKLSQLVEYRAEYARQLQQQASVGIAARQMHSYQSFISQLERGIEEQQRAVAQCKLKLEEKKQQWFTKRIKTRAMDKVMGQYLHKEQLEADKREQKVSDERAQAMSFRLMTTE